MNYNAQAYNLNEVVSFLKTTEYYGLFSNMKGKGIYIEVNGVTFRSSEALYQAMRFPDNKAVQQLIIEQRSPIAAKMVTKPFREDYCRKDWNDVRVGIMYWTLQVKAFHNMDTFGALLLETEDKDIVELSSKDDFWGAYPKKDSTAVGQNILGRLLMKLRAELREGVSTQVVPPSILNFTLYGESIKPLIKL
jgi:ribA/ribD-fused uncharacterized protein